MAEDTEVARSNTRSHRRSSSYGSTSEMAAQLGYREAERDLRHGYSYSDIHSDYPPEDEYFCKYTSVLVLLVLHLCNCFAAAVYLF